MTTRLKLEHLKRIAQLASSSELSGSNHRADQKVFHTGIAAIDSHVAPFGLPLGAVHEFAGQEIDEEQASLSAGFAALCLKHCLAGKPVLWISPRDDLYAPGLSAFGLDPQRLILVSATREQEVRWTVEEALRCTELGAVVAEIGSLDLTSSRRFQLAAEKGGLPCFILRRWRSATQATAKRMIPISAVTRWRIRALPSPALTSARLFGAMCWQIDLWRCRNGRPGSWIMEITHAAEHGLDVSAFPVALATPLADRPLASHAHSTSEVIDFLGNRETERDTRRTA